MGRVGSRLERATYNRVITVSNPVEAVQKLLQFPLPHFASVFSEETLKAVGPVLPCAIINRPETSHEWGKCVACRGLSNSTWSIMSTRR